MTREPMLRIVGLVLVGLSLTAARAGAQERPKLVVDSAPAYKIEALLENKQSIVIGDRNADAQRVIVIKQAFDPNSILCIEHPKPVASWGTYWGSTTLTNTAREKPKGAPDSPGANLIGIGAADPAPAPEPSTPAIPARTCKTITDWLFAPYQPVTWMAK